MRIRERADSPLGQRLQLSWDNTQEANAESAQDEAMDEAAPMQPPRPEASDQETAPSQETTPAAAERDTALPAPAVSEESDSPNETSLDADQSESETIQDDEGHAEDEVAEGDSQEEMDSSSPESAEATAGFKAGFPFGKASRKSAPTVNIIPRDEKVGAVLSRTRERANVQIEDLARRLNIDSAIIQHLENGDYESLSRAYGNDNLIYIVMFFKTISEELGLSKNEIDALVERLYQELNAAGVHFDQPPQQTDEQTESARPSRPRPVKNVLPKLIVFALFLICLLIFFLSVVMPYVQRTRPGIEKRSDYVPLLESPWKSPRQVQPQQLPVP